MLALAACEPWERGPPARIPGEPRLPARHAGGPPALPARTNAAPCSFASAAPRPGAAGLPTRKEKY